MAGATRGLTLFLKGSGAPVLIQSQFTLTGLPTPPPGGSDPISNGKKAWVVWRTGPQRTRLAQVRARARWWVVGGGGDGGAGVCCLMDAGT